MATLGIEGLAMTSAAKTGLVFPIKRASEMPLCLQLTRLQVTGVSAL